MKKEKKNRFFLRQRVTSQLYIKKVGERQRERERERERERTNDELLYYLVEQTGNNIHYEA